MHKKLLLLLGVLAFFCLTADEALHLDIKMLESKTLQDFETYDQHRIQIRGFLYPSEDGEAILSSHPNLKSCCIGSQDLATEHIRVSGLHPLQPDKAVTIEGVFRIAPEYNANGKLNKIFYIDKAILLKQSESYYPLIIATTVFLGVSAILILMYRRRKYVR